MLPEGTETVCGVARTGIVKEFPVALGVTMMLTGVKVRYSDTILKPCSVTMSAELVSHINHAPCFTAIGIRMKVVSYWG
jgi:hypothetical protein